MIATIAVVPTRLGAALLADGPCGARPPTLWSSDTCGHAYHREWSTEEDRRDGPTATCYMCCNPTGALVLFHENAIVGEGVDRATRAGGFVIVGCNPWEMPFEYANAVANYLVRIGLAERIVLLVADGDEVTP